VVDLNVSSGFKCLTYSYFLPLLTREKLRVIVVATTIGPDFPIPEVAGRLNYALLPTLESAPFPEKNNYRREDIGVVPANLKAV
jgi:hypothetical protein